MGEPAASCGRGNLLGLGVVGTIIVVAILLKILGVW
jgi:hypothetical protein